MAEAARVGLVVPPARGTAPHDARAMYPDVEFLVEGIGVRDMSAAGYAEAVGRLGTASAALARRGAQAVLLFGTSLSFFRGAAYNDQLEAVMAEASGLPCRTLTSAMTEAFRSVGAQHLAVATAYTDEVNAMFARYFAQQGFAIDAIAGLDLVSLEAAEQTQPDRIADLACDVRARAPAAEALVISCAGLATSSLCPVLEREFGIPAISSAMVGAWAAVRLAGAPARLSGFGWLYEQ
jgi:arylmalonate decarboxylase